MSGGYCTACSGIGKHRLGCSFKDKPVGEVQSPYVKKLKDAWLPNEPTLKPKPNLNGIYKYDWSGLDKMFGESDAFTLPPINKTPTPSKRMKAEWRWFLGKDPSLFTREDWFDLRDLIKEKARLIRNSCNIPQSIRIHINCPICASLNIDEFMCAACWMKSGASAYQKLFGSLSYIPPRTTSP